MPILGFIEDACIKVPLASADKNSAIRELMDLVCKSGGVTDRDDALEAVMEREALMSTGIGHGVAIPHGKADSVTHLADALAHISKLLSTESFRERLTDVETADEVIGVIQAGEQRGEKTRHVRLRVASSSGC